MTEQPLNKGQIGTLVGLFDDGIEIADRYSVTFTPTFILFNGSGAREEEFTLVLDRARVMYWLDQQTITP